MAKLKLRHVAIRTANPEETAAWYRDVFDLEEVGRTPNGVYLSDGEINFAVLRTRPDGASDEAATGVNHFGFLVDNPDEIYRKLEAKGAKRLGAVPGAAQYYETKFEGPDGQIIDISEHGWVGAKGLE